MESKVVTDKDQTELNSLAAIKCMRRQQIEMLFQDLFTDCHHFKDKQHAQCPFAVAVEIYSPS